MKNQAQLFFENYIDKPAEQFVILAQSGSARINYLATIDNKQYIITQNNDIRENQAFFYFSNIFETLELNTPKILAINDTRDIYVQEFLGKNTLSEIIAEEGLSQNVRYLVKQSLEQLYRVQSLTQNKIDYNNSFEYQAYDDLPILHDLYYFKNFLVDVLEIPYHKSTLLKEFKSITTLVENLSPKGIMIRDFQSRNIMVDQENKVHFIDYQAAMHGPLMYDVISFLYQAKANFPDDFKTEMLNHYYQLWNDILVIDNLKASFEPLLMMRYLQVLGAYGFRGIIQRKKHFLQSLDQGIGNIGKLALTGNILQNYPEIYQLILNLNSEKTQQKIKEII